MTTAPFRAGVALGDDEPYECRGQLSIHTFSNKSERTSENNVYYPLRKDSCDQEAIRVRSEPLHRSRHSYTIVLGLSTVAAYRILPNLK